jgi:hypothetical protein
LDFSFVFDLSCESGVRGPLFHQTAAARYLQDAVSAFGLNAVRYGIPLVLFVAGCVIAAIGGNVGLAAGAMFVSAATAVLLLNLLYRIGVQGDKERDREDAARRYFDEHGRWPS